MTQNNINEWKDISTRHEVIAHAVESAMTSYKENDTDTIHTIFKNAMKRCREIWRAGMKKEQFQGIKLSDDEKELLMNARLRADAEKMLSTFSALVENYQQGRLWKYFRWK